MLGKTNLDWILYGWYLNTDDVIRLYLWNKIGQIQSFLPMQWWTSLIEIDRYSSDIWVHYPPHLFHVHYMWMLKTCTSASFASSTGCPMACKAACASTSSIYKNTQWVSKSSSSSSCPNFHRYVFFSQVTISPWQHCTFFFNFSSLFFHFLNPLHLTWNSPLCFFLLPVKMIFLVKTCVCHFHISYAYVTRLTDLHYHHMSFQDGLQFNNGVLRWFLEFNTIWQAVVIKWHENACVVRDVQNIFPSGFSWNQLFRYTRTTIKNSGPYNRLRHRVPILLWPKYSFACHNLKREPCGAAVSIEQSFY